MSALTDALAKIQQVHDNEQALADPVAIAWQAQMAFFQALVTTIEGGSSASTSPVSAETVSALQAENDQLKAQVAAGASAVAAFEAALHPQEPASSVEPSSSEPPTISPSNPA